MELAFEALAANDDDASIGNVLDGVLGDDGSGSRDRPGDGDGGFNLDFLGND